MAENIPKTKSGRQKQVFHIKRPVFDGPMSMDKEKVLDWLEKNNDKKIEDIQYTVYSPYTDRWHHFIKANTVKKAVLNNHLDLEIFLHIRRSIVRFDKKNRKPHRIPYNSLVWMIDLDNFRHADSIQGLRDYIVAMNLPLPVHITQTSQHGFHLVMRRTWNEEKKLKYVELLVGFDSSSWYGNKREYDRVMTSLGVDMQLYDANKKNPENAKVRIGNCVHKRVKGGKTEYFLTKFETTPKHLLEQDLLPGCDQDEFGRLLSFNPPAEVKKIEVFKAPVVESVVESVSKEEVEIAEVVEVKKDDVETKVIEKQIPEFAKSKYSLFYNVLSKVLPANAACKFAKLLSENFTLLKKGKLSLSQTKLAKDWELTQATVSRYLKSLIEAGVLEITEEYYYEFKNHFNRTPRVYGMGNVLKKAVEDEKSKQGFFRLKHDISEKYQKGITNEAMMCDIRFLYLMGYDVAKITEFCYNKEHDSKGYGRKWREVKTMVVNWVSKYDHRYVRLKEPPDIVKESVRDYLIENNRDYICLPPAMDL